MYAIIFTKIQQGRFLCALKILMKIIAYNDFQIYIFIINLTFKFIIYAILIIGYAILIINKSFV